MIALVLAASLWQPATIYGASVGADTYSTWRTWDAYAAAGHRGPVDVNPLLRSREALLGWQAVRASALVGADYWLQKKGHKKAVLVLRIGVPLICGGLAYRNWRNEQAARAYRP